MIVYRTCANLYGYGIDEPIRRINRACEYGADYTYVDGIKSLEELKRISELAFWARLEWNSFACIYSMGNGVTNASSLDPLAFQVAIVGVRKRFLSGAGYT